MTTTIITTAATFKAFCQDNSHLTAAELQAQWRSIKATRQNQLSAQFTHGRCSSTLEYKQMGTVASKGKWAGTTRVAQIARVTATSAQIESARIKAAAAAEKTDAALATLAVDAPAFDHFTRMAAELAAEQAEAAKLAETRANALVAA